MLQAAIGVDVGGTKLAAGLVDANGRILERVSAPTLAQRGGPDVMERLLSLVEQLLKQSKPRVEREGMVLAGIGIGTAGEVDSVTGRVLYATDNLPGWTGMPIQERFEARFGLPAAVDNDGNAAAWGEKLFGSGRGRTDLVCMTIGTGIGGGVIAGGRLVRGIRGSAGSLGHISIRYDGIACNCGSQGCVEAYASGPAMTRRAWDAVRRGEESVLRNAVAAASSDEDGALSDPEAAPPFSGAQVVEAARAGDPVALRAVRETGEYLGYAAAIVANLLNPEAIVVGGGVAAAGELLFRPMRQSFTARALPEVAKSTQILPAALGADAGLVGAAGLILAPQAAA